MRQSIVIAFVALAAVVSVTSSGAQEIPAAGFTALVCQLGVNGSGTYCAPGRAQFCVDVQDQAPGDAGGTRTASVTVHHGQSSSDHVVTYSDNGDGTLNCGDVVLSVQ